ncbi:MAG: phosphate acyltransferase PlsX [Neisseriaceae bacterium]|nr:phosphate acyltransferase PlsX [Neisseriaceae bacterium]
MITIAVDAMGGDNGLTVTAPAAAQFLQRNADARLIMVGDETALKNALVKANAPLERIEIVHASEVVAMDEAPQHALKNKKDSSMRVAINQVKDGRAAAAVSAGNTGALMATARFVLKTVAGIQRPAIAKFLPAKDDQLVCALDLGANVDCPSEQLLQFAIMGTQLVKAMQPEKNNPTVGLLNVGTEEIKGTDTVKAAYSLLKNSHLNFVGNVEGSDIFSGSIDVIVCDGFVGNIVLKTIEGTVGFVGGMIKDGFTQSLYAKWVAMWSMPVLKKFKQKVDPRRFNGAIFLGLRGIVIKSHGGTDEIGFAYALEEAYKEVKADFLKSLEQAVEQEISHLDI